MKTKGVCWDKREKKWFATLTVNGKTVLAKRFDDKLEAVIARKFAEIEYCVNQRYEILEDCMVIVIESKDEEYRCKISREDYEQVSQYRWSICNCYVATNIDRKTHKLHRMLTGYSDKQIDHINGDKLDNRRCNLREATPSQNNMNRCVQTNNSSGHIGVCWHKQANKWRTYIKVEYKHISLGLYDNIEDAVNARKDAEKKYFGEFARKTD